VSRGLLGEADSSGRNSEVKKRTHASDEGTIPHPQTRPDLKEQKVSQGIKDRRRDKASEQQLVKRMCVTSTRLARINDPNKDFTLDVEQNVSNASERTSCCCA